MEKVRIGVIGVGNMGSGHLKSIKNIKNSELTAVCDIDREKADKYSTEYDVKAYYTSDEMSDL